MLVSLVMAGCPGSGGDDGEATTSSGTSTSTSTASSVSVTASSTSSASASGSATGTSASDTSSSTTSGATETSASTGADETAGSSSSGGLGEPVPCTDDLVCPAGEVCVLPCCGGPAPGCGPVDAAMCPPGTIEVDSCPNGLRCGGAQLCCQDGPCMADPPFCAPADELLCDPPQNGGPQSNCSFPCFGSLFEGTLSCDCA